MNCITSNVLTFTSEGSQLEKKREKEAEHLFEEIIAENFSNLEKKTNISVQKAQTVPNKMNPERFRPRQIMIKMAKIRGKERI